MITAGLDIGSLMTKAVVLNDGKIVGWGMAPTGDSSTWAAESALKCALKQTGLSFDVIEAIVTTGAGKTEVSFVERQSTEVECLARGIHYLLPDIRGVIDMGCENTLVLNLDDLGMVTDFSLNDKCAAGSGVFLDAMAKAMAVTVDEMGLLSLQSTTEVNITSTCTVFAESEVVSQIHRQTPKKDLLRAIHKSVATRIYGMISKVHPQGEIAATGGLARNIGIVASLEEMMQDKLSIPDNPQIVMALGAAIIATEKGST